MFGRISNQQRKFKKNAKNIALGRKDQLCEWEVSGEIELMSQSLLSFRPLSFVSCLSVFCPLVT